MLYKHPTPAVATNVDRFPVVGFIPPLKGWLSPRYRCNPEGPCRNGSRTREGQLWVKEDRWAIDLTGTRTHYIRFAVS